MTNLTGLPYAQPDPSLVDPIFAAEEEQRKLQMQRSVLLNMQRAIERDPELETQIHKTTSGLLDLNIDVPDDMVRHNYKKAASFLEVLQIRNADLENQAPELYAAMGDPTWGALVANDWSALAWTEQAGKGLEAGDIEYQIGQIMTSVLEGGASYESVRAQVSDLDMRLEELNVGDTFWGQTGKTIGQLWQWETLGNLTAAIPLVGLPVAVAWNARMAYKLEAGLAFHEYLKSGIDYQVAATNAHAVGLINAGIEASAFLVAVKPLRAFTRNVVGRSKPLRRMVSRLAGNALSLPVAKRALAATAGRAALQSGTEVTEEILQESVTALFQRFGIKETQEKLDLRKPGTKIELPGGGELLVLDDGGLEVDASVYGRVTGEPVNPGTTVRLSFQVAQAFVRDVNEVVLPAELILSDEEFWSDLWGVATQTASIAFKGTVLLASTGPVLQHFSEVRRVKRAEYQRKTTEQLLKKVKGIRLQQKDAGALALLFRRQWAQGDLKEVHVDRDRLREAIDKTGLTIEEVEEVLPGLTEQLNASEETNPTVVLDGATFFSELAETDLQKALLDDIKPTALDLSIRESRDKQDAIAAEAKELSKSLAQVNEGRKEFDNAALELATFVRDSAVAAGANPRQAADAAALFAVQQKELARQVSEKRGEVVTPTQLLEERLPEGVTIKDLVVSEGKIAFSGEATGRRLKMFVGTRAGKALGKMDSYKEAQRMGAARASTEDIRKKTGWFIGDDGVPRLEITDDKVRLLSRPVLNNVDPMARQLSSQPGMSGHGMGATDRLRDIIDHPELFQAYPELGELEVESRDFGGNMNLWGHVEYYPTTQGIKKRIAVNEMLSDEDLIRTLLHEIQHTIQDEEGMSLGGSAQEFMSRGGQLNIEGQLVDRVIGDAIRDGVGNRAASYARTFYNYLREHVNVNAERTAESTLAASKAFTYAMSARAEAQLAASAKESSRMRTLLSDLQTLAERAPVRRKQGKRTLSLYVLQEREAAKKAAPLYYRRLAGEVEARNTETRRSLTEAERRDTPPSSTEDITKPQLIFKMSRTLKLADPASGAGRVVDPQVFPDVGITGLTEEAAITRTLQLEVEDTPAPTLSQKLYSDANFLKWTPPKTKDGKIKGAPEWVKSMRDVTKLRKLLHKMVQEGMVGRYWYERSARRVLQVVQDDVADAEKLLQLIAIYSPLADIWSNLVKATKAYEHWKSGKPAATLKFGFEKQNEKARAVLYDNKDFEGRKTNTFYVNLMFELYQTRRAEVDALNLDPDVIAKISGSATIDLWMYRAFGYHNEQGGNDKEGKYSFSENMTRRVTAELNASLPPGAEPFLPMQVQAMIWTAMKTRYETPEVKAKTNARSKKEGLVHEVTKKDAAGNARTIPVYGKTAEEKRRHLQNWRTEALKLKSEQVKAAADISARDFSDDLERMTETVTWEALPAQQLGEDINTAPDPVVREFTHEARALVTDPQGLDLLAQMLGVVFYHGKMSYGGFDGGVIGNVLSSLVPLKPAGPNFSVKQVRVYTRALQYIFKQEAVPWFRLENTDVWGNKSANQKQKFRVLNASGRTLPKGLFDDQRSAERFAASRPGSEVVGGELAASFRLKFKRGLTKEDRQTLMDSLTRALHKDAGFTQLSDNEVLVVNYRGDKNLPFMMTDEEMLLSLDTLADQEKNLGIEKIDVGYAQGEYGDVHNWAKEPDGSSILKAHFAGRPDLQTWLRGRRAAFEALLKQYDADGIARSIEALVASGTAVEGRRRGGRLHGPDGRHRSGSETSVRYGRERATADSTSVLGVHFGPTARLANDARRYGQGKPGAERRRVAGHPVLGSRSYYYVDTGAGIVPEHGVGGELHSVHLDNLYDTKEDPLGIIKQWSAAGSNDPNLFELAIVQAGFDGYYVPKAFALEQGAPTDTTMGGAILLGPEHETIPLDYQGTYTGDYGLQPRVRQMKEGTTLGEFDLETFQIILGKKHTAATLSHELAHLHFEQLIQLYLRGDLNAQQIADLETLIELSEDFDSLDDYATAPRDVRYGKLHEQVAHLYEKYLRKGEAPSLALKNLFARMSRWFKRTYAALRRIDENYAAQYPGENLPALSKDVRMVFDRWFASEEEIDLRNRELMLGRLLLNEDLDPIDELFVEELIFEHERTAKEKLRAVFMGELKRLRRMRDREFRKMQRQHRRERKRVEGEELAALLRESHLARMLSFLSNGELLDSDGNLVDSFGPLKLAYAVNKLNEALRDQSELREDVAGGKSVAESSISGAADKLAQLRETLRSLKETLTAVKKEVEVQKKSGVPDTELLARNKQVIAEIGKQISDAETEAAQQRKLRDDSKAELHSIARDERAAANDVEKAKKLVGVTKKQLGAEGSSRSKMFFTSDERIPARYRTSDPKAALVLDVDGFARRAGFASADQMFDALRVEMVGAEKATEEFVSGETVYTAEGDPAGESLQDMVDDRADRRMLAEMPHLADPEEMQYAIDNAMTTEALLKLRAAEVNLLGKKAPAERETLRTAKAVAKSVVGKLKLRDLFGRKNVIRKFIQAAQRAEIEAAKSRGDVAAVGKHKRTALMQRALAQEAIARRDLVTKSRDKLTKQLRYGASAKRETRLAQAYGGAFIETSRWILNAMGVEVGSGLAASNDAAWRPYGMLAEDDPAKGELALAYDDGRLIVEEQGVLDEQTVEQAVESLLFVEGLMMKGKQLQTIVAGDLELKVQGVVEELERRVKEEKAPKPATARKTWWEERWAGLRKWRSTTQRFEHLVYALDNDTFGLLSQIIFTPARRAEDTLELRYSEVSAELVKLMKPVRADVAKAKDLHTNITSDTVDGKPLLVDENGAAFVFRGGVLDILGSLLHSGNEGNLQRLLTSYGWAPRDENGEFIVDENGHVDTSLWWEQVRRWEKAGVIKKEHWAFAQGVWDVYEKYLLPLTQDAHLEMLGREMETVAKGGLEMETRKLVGGYVPAAPEPTRRSVKGQNHAQENLLGFMRMIPAVFKGHILKRVQQPKPDPLDINPLHQLVHFRQQLVFATMGPVHRKVAHLLRNEKISGLLERLSPDIYQNLIKHWLEAVATLSSTMIEARSNDMLSGLDFLMKIRANYGTAAMFGHVINSLQGATGVLLAKAKVDYRHLAQGVKDGMREDGMSKADIYEKSAFLAARHRLRTSAFEVNQQILELVDGSGPLGLAKISRWVSRNTYLAQEAIQIPVDLIVWRGAFDQALAQGLTEDQAIGAADSAVRQTQSDTAVTSMAKAEKGSNFQKLFTQFMSWFLSLGSLSVSPLRRATIRDRNLREEDAALAKRVAYYAASVALSKEAIAGFVSLYIGELIMDAMSEKDEDEPALDLAGSLYQTVLAVPRAFGPVAAITSTVIATLSGAEPYQQRMPAPAVVSILQQAARNVSKLYDDDGVTASDTADLLELIAMVMGLPVQVVTRRLRRGLNLFDEDDQEARPMSLLTGR